MVEWRVNEKLYLLGANEKILVKNELSSHLGFDTSHSMCLR